jgi:hypothetical protein
MASSAEKSNDLFQAWLAAYEQELGRLAQHCASRETAATKNLPESRAADTTRTPEVTSGLTRQDT